MIICLAGFYNERTNEQTHVEHENLLLLLKGKTVIVKMCKEVFKKKKQFIILSN